MLTEADIIDGCRRHSKPGQRELVRRYSGMLFTVCRRYARDDSSARDMLQESLLRIFGSIKDYRPTGSFEAWIRTIAVRCSLKWLRDKEVRYEPFADAPEEDFVDDAGINTHLDVEAIIAEIQALPPSLRAVFNLYAIEGYKHREIGVLLGISESSSRVHLTRARKALQERLKEAYPAKYRSI